MQIIRFKYSFRISIHSGHRQISKSEFVKYYVGHPVFSKMSALEFDEKFTTRFNKFLLRKESIGKVFEKYDLKISLCNDINQLFSIGDIMSFTIASKPNNIEEAVIIDVHIYSSHGDNFYMNSNLGYLHFSPKFFFSDFI